ncbi:MAG TPA: methylenetetrahydrofolate reductase C-terminal domain-containing protein [Chloroflexota bacterium]
MAGASPQRANPGGVPAADDPARGDARLGPEHPRPTAPRTRVRAMRALHGLLAPGRLWRRVALWLESSPGPYRVFTRTERIVKRWLFGCRMCAQCTLPTTAYTCPMTCPKQLRNGPCGGVSPEGNCEVYPDLRCVWVVAYERAAREGRVADLRRLQRPIDQRRWGQSSWVSYWLGRDGSLWTEDDGLGGEPPPIRVEPSAGGGP